MADTLYALISITGIETEPAADVAIASLRNNSLGFEVLETILDDGTAEQEMGATIYFP